MLVVVVQYVIVESVSPTTAEKSTNLRILPGAQ